jgi:HNH endonuclease
VAGHGPPPFTSGNPGPLAELSRATSAGVSNAPPRAPRLDDAALAAQLPALAAARRQASVELVAHLAELEARELDLRLGYTSLYVYCRDALAVSEHEAYHLVAAARAARRYPLVLEMLADGSLNLTSLRLLGPHLTPANHRQVLETARGKRRAQVEEIVALLVPQPDVPPAIQRLLSPGVAPLSADRYRVQLTIGGGTVEKLRLARDMLRHALPTGDDAEVLERALTSLLAELARKKFAAVGQPRAARGTAPGSRHVPAEVKREVWLRDLGRCAFVGTSGRRCAERGYLEFHHVRPFAAGGPPTVENIQLRCRRHNGHEARAYFGLS